MQSVTLDRCQLLAPQIQELGPLRYAGKQDDPPGWACGGCAVFEGWPEELTKQEQLRKRKAHLGASMAAVLADDGLSLGIALTTEVDDDRALRHLERRQVRAARTQ